MKSLIPLLLICSFATGSLTWGNCPSVSLRSPSDITGTWFEIVQSSSIEFEKGDCTTATYTLNSENTLTVLNSEIVGNKPSSVIETAYCEGETAQCYVRFSPNAPYGD